MGASVYNSDAFDGNIDIPIYGITPEAIFKGKIPLFDVNFFDPNQETVDYSWMTDYVPPTDWEDIGSATLKKENGKYKKDSELNSLNSELKNRNSKLSLDKIQNKDHKADMETTTLNESGSWYKNITYYVFTDGNISGTYRIVEETQNSKDFKVTISYNASTSTSYGESNNGEGIHSLSYELQNIVANWYYRILIVALVGMMSVLVYMGIRILISSTASDKAKYKQMLGDWVIGMVILFMMHYGMVFANRIADKITTMLGDVNPHFYVQAIEDPNGKIEKALGKDGAKFDIEEGNASDAGLTDKTIIKDTVKIPNSDGGVKEKHYLYFSTNLMGKLRYDVQANKSNSSAYIGYTVLFAIMVIYLFVFSFTYMKRVVYMAFLTIIAPLVALTYPIDKVNDGQAQGFNYWFKEYTFNLLLQPLHLLLYTILISSAIKLASENMIYAIVAMGFMVPAEKILRQMFNFGKASTPGVFGGAAGAAMVMGGLKWIAGRGPKGPSGSGGSSGGSGDSSNKSANAGIHTSKALPDLESNDKKSIPRLKRKETTDNSKNRNIKRGPTGATIKRKISSPPVRNIKRGPTGAVVKRKTSSPQSTPPSSEQTSRWEKITKRIAGTKVAKGFVAGKDAWKDGMKQKWKRSLAEGRPIKRMARIAVGAPIAAAGALVGTAAGAASGDAGNAVKYGAGAGAALYSLRKYADVIGNDLAVEGVPEEMNRAMYGNEEYDRRQALRKQKEMMEDANNISTIEKEKDLDRNDAKKYLEEIVPFYADNKINDVDTMLDLENVAEKAYANEYNSDSAEKKKLARQAAFQGYHHEQMYGFNSKSKEADIEALEKKMQKENDYSDKETKSAMKFVNNYLKYSKKVKA